MSTAIPYLDEVWSPIVGCTPAQPAHGGCDHCWSRELHEQRHRAYLAGKRLPQQYSEPFATVRCLPERLEEPLHWRKPRRIGVAFGADLFHPSVPDWFVCRAYRVMEQCPHHTFVVLTKRAERMARFAAAAAKSAKVDHVIHGVTIENQAAADERLPWLLQVPGRKWISYEPALGPVDWCDLEGPNIDCSYYASDPTRSEMAQGVENCCRPENPAGRCHATFCPFGRMPQVEWLVMGCESGPGRRLAKCDVCGGDGCEKRASMGPVFTACGVCDGTGYAAWEWARQTRDACQAAGVAYWLKQLPDHQGRVIHAPTLDGRQWLEVPR